ncbi:hypothetical protein [Phytohabitans rumicis]|uniref:Uncharacterized protein n=1 Tax=Phytohabitans rumicis TaxID=1076125 RepID=A0A6V8LAK0_9ACTN|nr:hypothetical protein [Phytohabitans rumicis]GFJ91579.1 hypothetical protein Prum_052210 [Phytohabitans rumicis]
MSGMKPSLGRVVHYMLNAGDVGLIDQRIPIKGPDGMVQRNPVHAGQVLPAEVVAVFDAGAGTANLKVKLDGYGEHWATSRVEGTTPGTWAWPPRV